VQKSAQEAPLRSRSPVSDLLNLRFIDGHLCIAALPAATTEQSQSPPELVERFLG
jgi:hypothetical protein